MSNRYLRHILVGNPSKDHRNTLEGSCKHHHYTLCLFRKVMDCKGYVVLVVVLKQVLDCNFRKNYFAFVLRGGIGEQFENGSPV